MEERADSLNNERNRCIEAWGERNNTVSVLTESVLRLKRQSDSLSNFVVNRR